MEFLVWSYATVHPIPDFYRSLDPLSGESPTPIWDLTTHLSFMVNNSIARDILSISSPGSAVYPGNEAASAGLARLLNKWLAELANAPPQRFGVYSVIPLPYINAAYQDHPDYSAYCVDPCNRLKESKHTFAELRANRINLLTNHEGLYRGNSALQPFFEALNDENRSTVLFVHPTLSVKRVNGTLVTSNPRE